MKKDNRITDIEINLSDADIIVASDIHFPYQDDKAVEAFIRYVESRQPKVVVLNGDVLDFYKLSRFSKDPAGKNPAEEIEMCREFLKNVRKVAPNSDIYYVIGNHETRLEKYVLDNAPQIACLVDNVFEIIKVDREDMCVKGCASLTVNDTFVFKHGTRLGNKSGLSAIKELEAHYLSGATGHCHKLARFSTRKSGRRFIWLETGCLCDLNPEYMVNADWEQGFAHIKFRKRKLYQAKIVQIENGVILE